MKSLINGTKTFTIAATIIFTFFSFSYANSNFNSLNRTHTSIVKTVAVESYSFKVHNNTDTTIKQILVSADGNNYGYFDIGNGITPGQTIELVWDQSTNGESCHQYFKAVFAGGEESQPVKFDFCEKGLVLEF